MANFVQVCDLVTKLHLEVIQGNTEALGREIKTSDISRPGLELTGYFSYYSNERIQLLGKKEISFMEKLTAEKQLEVMKKICTEETPAIVVCRNLDFPKEILVAAAEENIPVLRTPMTTSRLLGAITSYLDECLAIRTSIHGVLMEVYGLGVLIQGDSGIGKSETGLELIKSGHRLIADDRVDVYQKDEITVVGEPPEILKNLLEIRGIGIIDVMNLFGASAVRPFTQIQLAIYLQTWEKGREYDRLGNKPKIIQISDVNVPQICVPVKTGRNLSSIIETAAMNFRAKTMGFDATQMFENRLTSLIEENSNS